MISAQRARSELGDSWVSAALQTIKASPVFLTRIQYGTSGFLVRYDS